MDKDIRIQQLEDDLREERAFKNTLKNLVDDYSKTRHDALGMASAYRAKSNINTEKKEHINQLIEETMGLSSDRPNVMQLLSMIKEESGILHSRYSTDKELVYRICEILKRPLSEGIDEIVPLHIMATEASSYFITDDEHVTSFRIDKEKAYVKAPKDSIWRLVFNMFTNAVESMKEPGSLYAEIGVIKYNPEDRIGKVISGILEPDIPYSYLSVRDEGEGISEDVMENLRRDQNYSTKGEGRGNGIEIMKRIVLDNSGALVIDSEVGKGSEVISYLPSVDPE